MPVSLPTTVLPPTRATELNPINVTPSPITHIPPPFHSHTRAELLLGKSYNLANLGRIVMNGHPKIMTTITDQTETTTHASCELKAPSSQKSVHEIASTHPQLTDTGTKIPNTPQKSVWRPYEMEIGV